MKKFKVSYTDISESGYYSSGNTDYGIVSANNAEEAREIIANQVVSDAFVSLHGINYRKQFCDRLDAIEVE